MADILIRGMDIPKDGRKHTALLQFLEDGKCRGIVEYSKSYDDRSVKVFEVVQLPEGHGKLIDAEALFEKMYHLSDNEGAHKDSRVDDALILRDSACILIEDAPSIVPAEGGGEDG